MSVVNSLDILRFVEQKDKANKNQFSIDELVIAFPNNDSDLLLEKLIDLKRAGFIERVGPWAYAPTQIGFDILANL